MSRSSQRGFTLIELVVVIVILGILAAFAVPRFMGLENEARVATVKSMGGALRSASAMAHGVCMAQGCANNATLNIMGRNVTFVQGYPNRATIDDAMETVEGFTFANQGGGSVRFTKTGARTAACWVQYNQAANATTPPTISYAAGVSGVVAEAAIDAALRNAC